MFNMQTLNSPRLKFRFCHIVGMNEIFDVLLHLSQSSIYTNRDSSA